MIESFGSSNLEIYDWMLPGFENCLIAALRLIEEQYKEITLESLKGLVEMCPTHRELDCNSSRLRDY